MESDSVVAIITRCGHCPRCGRWALDIQPAYFPPAASATTAPPPYLMDACGECRKFGVSVSVPLNVRAGEKQ
jgi:hypothetical protein